MTQCCDVLVDPNFLEDMKKVFVSGEAKDLVDPYLVFRFAGLKVSFRRQHTGGHAPRTALCSGRHLEGQKCGILKFGRFWRIDVCIADNDILTPS